MADEEISSQNEIDRHHHQFKYFPSSARLTRCSHIRLIFESPADAAQGSATIKLAAAWINGPDVRIAVQ
jgi:hypothetical protein